MIFQEVFSPVDEMPELTEDQARKMREKYEADGSQLPPIERPEPGFWSGMGEGIYRGTASGALKSMSFAETAIANTGLAQSAQNMAQIENGESFDQISVSDIQKRAEQDAKEYREIAKRDFAADPSLMGTAGQILYGVFETIPKAVAYSTIAGPAGGSVLFGADLGVSRAQELMDEGVDQNTATWAGIATFGMSALGMRVPAVFGKSRIASATIGAAVNTGLTAAETQSVNWILQNQNYTELAERYRLNAVDLIVSGVFGGVMGGALWRARPELPANKPAETVRPALNDQLYNKLREASPSHITDEQVRYQADIHAVGIGALASKAGIDPYAIAPDIVRGESVDGGFNQRAWHGSPHTFDSFSTDNIGSGTGRSTYGWGLYFTKDKKVAEFYRDSLGGDSRLYEVDVPEDDVLLNSDATFAQQPKKIRDAINRLYDEEYGENPPPDWWDGRQVYQDIILREEGYTDPDDIPGAYEIDMDNGELAGNARLASEKLNSIGVKGVKFIGDNEDTSFVVFDDKAIQTIEYYQRQNQANGDALVEIEGSEFAPEIEQAKAGNKAPLIKKAVQFVQTIGNEVPPEDRLSRGTWERSIHNDTLGDIRITTRGARELRGEAISYPDNLIGLPALQSILEHGEFEGWRPNRKKDKKPNVEAYGRLRVDVLIGGEVRRVSVQLERYNNGKAYYFIETEKPSLARNFSQLSTASREGLSPDSNNTINIEVSARNQLRNQQIRGSFSPTLNRITLTPNADISTFSHEMGHFYLTDMFELSKLPASANSTLKEDVDILLKEWGIKSLKEWDELGVEGQRKYHEQFASWVEEYLSKGRSPVESLQRLFERMAQWICDVYRTVSLSKRYKDEFGIELPPPSKEVQKVLDRLFREDVKIQKSKQAVNKTQVAAARMVQANRTNENRLNELLALPDGPKKSKLLKDQMRSLQAQEKVLQQILRGQSPDAYEEVKDIDFDAAAMKEARGNFGRAYMMGENDTAVILQNRDRSDMSSIGQMNAIAANPQYGLVSVSRSYSGAPVISYGSVPDNSHLGNHDFIVETNGNRIPFMYAVVEAGDVETSNFIDGSTNQHYGDPKRLNAVVGNGRMTALKESYNRGTASEYRTELENDKAHGIDSDVIKGMGNPVLVRVINPEDVTTGFISRSNGEQVLARDDVEIAFEDAPKIRARAGQYEFDESGNPTNDTLTIFIQDLNDTNALGRLITSDGRPTPEAVRRIRNAVFFEAYQSPELSALFSQEVEPGIRRILNGMANVAPRIIELREEAQQLDFSGLLVEAANRIRQARLNPDEGADFASQMSFLDNPATSAFVEFLNDNANSAAAIARTLNPLVDWARNAARAADGEGLFGGDETVHVDLADVVGQLRNIVNDDRLARNLEALPDIDVEAIRSAINAANDAATRAVEAAAPVRARMEAQQVIDSEVAAQGEDALAVKRDLSEQVLNPETQQEAMMNLFADQVPDREYTVLDDLGREKQGTAQQLLAEAELGVIKAQQDRLGLGRSVECLIRNRGI